MVVGACIVAAGIALAAALADDTASLTSDDAADFTTDALHGAGIARVRLIGEPHEANYTRSDRPKSEPIAVWVTRARVRVKGKVYQLRLAIHETEGRAVSVDEGKQRFLTDKQFKRLGDAKTDAAVDRRKTRDTAGVIATVVLVLVGLWLALVRR